MGTIAEKLNKLQTTKQAIKEAIINKGVSVNDADTFASYADKINSITVGEGGSSSDSGFDVLGYSTPQFIQDGIDYAKEIKDNWDANDNSRSYEFDGDLQLIFFPQVDTSKVTNMTSMFYNCINLQYIPQIDISNATLIASMFAGCTSLVKIDISDWNTSKVTSMVNLFQNCAKLTSLDLSSLDTSNVTNMSYMFQYCSGLTSLDLSSFDTSNVTNMNSMFDCCSGLTSLDLSSFDTSNVTTMNFMFRNCIALTSLDLSNWNTSNVTNMQYLVYNCGKLQKINGYIDLSKISSYPTNFISSSSSYKYPLRYLIFKNIGKTGTTFNFNNVNLQNWGDETDTTTYPLSVGARQSLVDSFLTYSYDRASNGMSSCTIQLYSTVKARLTDDEIAAITAKGFTIA